MQNARLAYLFNRYVEHQCTPEEYQELMTLINEFGDDTLQQLLDKAYTGNAEHQLPDASAERMLSHILEQEPVRASNHFRYWMSGIAAAILVAVAFYAWLGNVPKQLQQAKPQLAQRIQSLDDHRFIKLADGSTVTLNKNSQLNYTNNFNGKTREVTLIGEGYFDIKHDATKPFLVHAGNLTITVLGTAFNINTINKIAVTVTRGKVSVSDHQKLLGAITPGQQITYNLQTRLADKITVDANQAVKWQAADLFFDNVTMQQAANMLENHFNVKVKFENEESKEVMFSASFTHGQNLQQVMNVICAFNKLTYAEDDGVITIK